MNETLRALYDSFYTPRGRKANRTLLRERIPSTERKLVLQIVDDLILMAGDFSQDNFTCGFKLAWRRQTNGTIMRKGVQHRR